MYYCVAGGGHGSGLQPLQRQVHVDTAFHGSSGHVYTLPSDAVFPLGHLHTRHGDSGAFAASPIILGKSTRPFVLKDP